MLSTTSTSGRSRFDRWTARRPYGGGGRSGRKQPSLITPHHSTKKNSFVINSACASCSQRDDCVPRKSSTEFHSVAFSPVAATGGFAGATVARTIEYGIRRGVISSEAGLGSAGIAHSAAKTSDPERHSVSHLRCVSPWARSAPATSRRRIRWPWSCLPNSPYRSG